MSELEKKIHYIEQFLFGMYLLFLLATPFFGGFFHRSIPIVLWIWFSLIFFLFFIWSFYQRRIPKLKRIEWFCFFFPFLYLLSYCFSTSLDTSATLKAFFFYEGFVLVLLIYRQVFHQKRNKKLGDFFLLSNFISLFLSFTYFSYPDLFMKLGYSVQYADFYPTSINRLYGTFGYPNMFALMNLLSFLLSFYRSRKVPRGNCIYLLGSFLFFLGLWLAYSKMILLYALLAFLFLFFIYRSKKDFWNSCFQFLGAAIIPILFTWKAFHSYMFHSNFMIFFLALLFGILLFFVLFWCFQHQKRKVVFSLFLLLGIFVCSLFPIEKPFRLQHVMREKNQYLIDLYGLKKDHDYELTLSIQHHQPVSDSQLRLVAFYLEDGQMRNETVTRFPLEEVQGTLHYSFHTKADFEYYYLQWIHINYETDLTLKPLIITDLETDEIRTYGADFYLFPYPLIASQQAKKYDQGSIMGRKQIYQDVWKVSQKHLLIGQGANAFYYYSLQNHYTHLAVEEHSYWFQLVMELGVLGVVMFLFIVVYFLFLSYRLWNQENALLIVSLVLLLGSISFDITMSFGLNFFLLFFLFEQLLERYESTKKKRVLWIASAGGHLTEVLQVQSLFSNYDSILITEKNYISQHLKLAIPIRYLKYCSRYYLGRYFLYAPYNVFVSFLYFVRYQPDLIYTTGAHTAVPMCYFAWLFGRKILFIEVFDRSFTPTLAGRLTAPIADTFIVQQETLLLKYPGASYVKGVYE